MPYVLESSAAVVSVVPPAREVYRFLGFVLDVATEQLSRDDGVVAVTAKSLQVLLYLLRHRERLVPRDELLAAVWPGVHVATGSLSQAIWEIREALADDARSPRMIQTVRRRGYR